MSNMENVFFYWERCVMITYIVYLCDTDDLCVQKRKGADRMEVKQKKQLLHKRTETGGGENKEKEETKTEQIEMAGQADTVMQNELLLSTVAAAPSIGNISSLVHALEERNKNLPEKKKSETDMTKKIEETVSQNPGKAVTGAKRVENMSETRQCIVEEKQYGKYVFLKEKQDLSDTEEKEGFFENPYKVKREKVSYDIQVSLNEEIQKKWDDFIKEWSLRSEYVYKRRVEKKKKIFVRLGHDSVRIEQGEKKIECFGGAQFKKGKTVILEEKDVIDKYGFVLATELFNMGYDVYIYRTKDFTFEGKNASINAVNAGIDAANEWKADYFISCHANSIGINEEKIYGTEILYNKNTTNSSHADQMLEAILNTLHTYRNEAMRRISKEKGMSKAAYESGLRLRKRAIPGRVNEMVRTFMPAILLEPLYISNPVDRAAFNECGGGRLGVAIAQCVDGFFKS